LALLFGEGIDYQQRPDGVSVTGGSQVVDLHDTTVPGDPGEPFGSSITGQQAITKFSCSLRMPRMSKKI
jgi:hypothetical protein